MQLERIQDALRRQNLDGWLFFDHHERDALAYRILGIKPGRHVTRRWYYLIPANGEPRKLVHRIEADMLDRIPGDRLIYSSWQEQHKELKTLLSGTKRVAMQYSPEGAVLHIAIVDAGTIELIRSMGSEIVSSAELVQEFEACLTESQFASHKEAGRRMDLIRAQAFQFVRDRIHSGVDELAVRDFVRDQFSAKRLTTDSGPIVAVDGHAGNPHYEPTRTTNSPIRPGSLVLLDMWAKLDQPDSAYYDITWTAFAGPVPHKVQSVFEAVRGARDAGVAKVSSAFLSGQEIRGFEVDDAVRGHLKDLGMDRNFVHRTGHSIGTEVHGTGANMDNLETHDERRILPGALFSIEPGLYFDDFGIRLELDMFVSPAGNSRPQACPTGEVQAEMVPLL